MTVEGGECMTTTQIECFLAAAQTSSFSKAAQNLYMAQPTFGRQIYALEQEVGYPLFIRGTKSNSLTGAGRVLYEGLQKLYGELQELLSDARKVYLGDTGRLSIGLLEGQLLDEETSRIIQRFRDAYPEIHVELSRFSFRAMLDAIRNHDLDIGITLTLDVQRHSELAFQELYSLSNELVFPKNHPLSDVENLTLADFSDDVFVEVAPDESSVVSELMRQTCREAGFEPQMKYVPDLKSQILCLESGQGIAALNQYHQSCNHPNLNHIHLPDFPDVSFCAAWLTEVINPAVQFFLRNLRIEKGT